MNIRAEIDALYRRVTEHDHVHTPGHRQDMLVLADALEESNDSQLALAYRYGSVHGRWPFLRNLRKLNDRGQVVAGTPVYDWDGVEHARRIKDARKLLIPEWALLPEALFNYLRKLPPDSKVYGTVNDAFRLLGRALEANPDELARIEADRKAIKAGFTVSRIDG